MGGTTAYSGPKGDLLWSEADCHDCSGCVGICPFHALEARYGRILVDMDRCTLCSLCERVCPTAAFTIERRSRDGEVPVASPADGPVDASPR